MQLQILWPNASQSACPVVQKKPLFIFFHPTAASPLKASPVSDVTTPGVPATGSMLDSAVAPKGTTLSISGFKVPGATTATTPGSAPVPVVDPATGTRTGTIAMQADGSYRFDPAPAFSGPVPPVLVTVTSSDGQIKEVPLTITVNPMLRDGSEDRVISVGTPSLTVDLLANVSPPPGTNVEVTSFTLPGSTTMYPVGSTPVTIVDPITSKTAGTIAVLADGTATFIPAPGFTGQAPPVTYVVTSSDGQTSPGGLSVTIQPGVFLGTLHFGHHTIGALDGPAFEGLILLFTERITGKNTLCWHSLVPLQPPARS